MYILYHCCNAVGVISVLMFLSIKANHALKRAGPNVTCARYGLTHWTLNYGNAQGIVNCGSIGIIMGEMRVGNALLRWAMEPVVSVLNLVMVNIFDRMSMILNHSLLSLFILHTNNAFQIQKIYRAQAMSFVARMEFALMVVKNVDATGMPISTMTVAI